MMNWIRFGVFIVMLVCAFLFLFNAKRTTHNGTTEALVVRTAAVVIASLTVILGVVWASTY